MINWINGFKAGKKKEKYEIHCRLGTFTVLEIKACIFCEADCTAKKFRVMVCNLGFEI